MNNPAAVNFAYTVAWILMGLGLVSLVALLFRAMLNRPGSSESQSILWAITLLGLAGVIVVFLIANR